jgi:hypothetical protein
MNAQELDRALAELGMTQSGAARYFDLGPRTIRYYLAGSLPVPALLTLMIEALRSRGIKPNELRRRAGLEPVDFSRPAGRQGAMNKKRAPVSRGP